MSEPVVKVWRVRGWTDDLGRDHPGEWLPAAYEPHELELMERLTARGAVNEVDALHELKALLGGRLTEGASAVASVDGREARDVALRRVDAAADPSWKRRALDAVRSLATAREFLTSDDVWMALGGTPPTLEPRAMGPIMLRARRLNWIEPTSEQREGRRGVNHARPQRVWRSRLYGAVA